MLKPRSPQVSFYGSHLYGKIVPADHLLRKINQVVDFSFVNDLAKDCYAPDFDRPAKDSEFMLRLRLLQYIYGDSDQEVVENARMHNGYKYFLGLAIDEEVPDDTTILCFRAQRLREAKFYWSLPGSSINVLIRGWSKGRDRSSTLPISWRIWPWSA